MHSKLGISIDFKDSEGNFWRRNAIGELVRTKEDMLENCSSIEHPIANWAEIIPAHLKQ